MPEPLTALKTFRVTGPRGTFDVRAITADAARHTYRNEFAVGAEAMKDVTATELPPDAHE